MARWYAAHGRCDACSPTLSRRGASFLTLAAIVGPTAAGKSEIAESVARRFHATIISVDSMQVYRGMDIGTAKPDARIRTWVDYRMVDVCDPGDDFTVHEFQRAARRHIEELATQYRRVIIAGGSGLHFRAVVDPLTFPPRDVALRKLLEEQPLGSLTGELITADPDAGALIDMENPRRVIRAVEIFRLTGQTPTGRASTPEASQVRAYESLYPMAAFGIDALDASPQRVTTRLNTMIESGLIAEVEALAPKLGTSASQAVGYRGFARMIAGEISREDAIADTIRATNGLVKRQRTYFRRDPRIEWIPWHDAQAQRVEHAVNLIGKKMQWIS
jgi:tRNA dimethylallyltransferase